MSTLQLQTYLERNSIKHPTALLHFERQLSDFEQGILFLCVHIVAKTEPGEDGFYYLNKSLVRAVTRQTGNQDYQRIEEAVKVVSRTELKFNFLGEDRTYDDYTAPLIIGRATNKKRGVIAFDVHPRIESVIKDPRVFSRLNIYFLSALYDIKRGYSFYALIKDFLDRQKATEVTISYFEFRHYLGIGDDIYLDFKLFKRKVLKPLVDAVNEKTDIKVEYEAVITGRTLTHLKFMIEKQPWQLQLFEREEVERLVGELAKNFDGPVIESTAIEQVNTDSPEIKRLVAKGGKHGVSVDTVKRAVAKFGEVAVSEIIQHGEKQFQRMTRKGEAYEAGDYLASLLNKGVGQKTPAEREKAVQLAQKAAERKAEKAAAEKAEKHEAERKERFSEYQRERAEAILAKRSDVEVLELGEAIFGMLPRIPAIRGRWQKIGKDARRLSMSSMHDRSIRPFVVNEVMKRWGLPEDRDYEGFQAQSS